MASKPAGSQSTPHVKPSGKAETQGAVSPGQTTTTTPPQTGSSTQLASSPMRGPLNANFGSGSSTSRPPQTTSTTTGSTSKPPAGTGYVNPSTGQWVETTHVIQPEPTGRGSLPQSTASSQSGVKPPTQPSSQPASTTPTQVKPPASVATPTAQTPTASLTTQSGTRPPKPPQPQPAQTGVRPPSGNQQWGGVPVSGIGPYQQGGIPAGGTQPNVAGILQQIAGMVGAMGAPITPAGLEPQYTPNQYTSGGYDPGNYTQLAAAPGSAGNEGPWVVPEPGRPNILYGIPTVPPSGGTPGGANIVTTNNTIPSGPIELSEPELEPLMEQQFNEIIGGPPPTPAINTPAKPPTKPTPEQSASSAEALLWFLENLGIRRQIVPFLPPLE